MIVIKMDGIEARGMLSHHTLPFEFRVFEVQEYCRIQPGDGRISQDLSDVTIVEGRDHLGTRNSLQSSICNSQFAICNSQFAICNSQFAVPAHERLCKERVPADWPGI